MMELAQSNILQHISPSKNFRTNINIRFGPGVYKELRTLEKLYDNLARETNHLTFLYKCKENNIVPKGLRISSLYHNHKIDKALHKASMLMIAERIWQHRNQKSIVSSKIKDLTNSLKSRFPVNDLEPVLNSITGKYDYFHQMYKNRHRKKYQALLEEHFNLSIENHNNNATRRMNNNTVINLSNHRLTTAQNSILSKGLNFAVTPKRPNNLDIITSLESAIFNTDQRTKEEIRWKVRMVLERCPPLEQNITKEEAVALKELRDVHSIKILPADKGNATVIMDSVDYENKLRHLISDDKYDTLKNDPTRTIEQKVYSVIKTHEKEFEKGIKTKLTPRNSKAPHLYGLPKIHKNDTPLRPIVSSIDSPCYALAKYLANIISPLCNNSFSSVKNSVHFVELIRDTVLEPTDLLVSFDVESLFTNVPLDIALLVIKQRLEDDVTLGERTTHSINALMDLLTICVRTTYFQMGTEFYKQKDGMAMGSPLSPIIANIFMEHFESIAISTSKFKPRLWLRYVDDTFLIWQHGLESVSEFESHLNSLHPTIKFTKEIEADGIINYLDVKVIRKPSGMIETTVYRKSTHTDLYLQYNSNHHQSSKSTVALSLFKRAKSICSNDHLLEEELRHITETLRKNGFSERVIQKARLHTVRTDTNIGDKPYVSIPYIHGVSEKVGRILNKFGYRAAYKSSRTLRSLLTKTRPCNNAKNTRNCVYCIPCECGRRYIGETGRPLATRISEHKKKVVQGDTRGSKIAQHAWEEEHHLQWDRVTSVLYEPNQMKRKFKEAAVMYGETQPISDPSIEFPELWFELTRSEIPRI